MHDDDDDQISRIPGLSYIKICNSGIMAVIDSITDVSTARIIRVLISGTTLRVTVQDQLGEQFTTSVGIPQGDGLSPVLFIIYLEAAMCALLTLDYTVTAEDRDTVGERA